jgi:hypothetical protein
MHCNISNIQKDRLAAVSPSPGFVPATVHFDLVVDFTVSSLSAFEPVVLWPGA